MSQLTGVEDPNVDEPKHLSKTADNREASLV